MALTVEASKNAPSETACCSLLSCCSANMYRCGALGFHINFCCDLDAGTRHAVTGWCTNIPSLVAKRSAVPSPLFNLTLKTANISLDSSSWSCVLIAKRFSSSCSEDLNHSIWPWHGRRQPMFLQGTQNCAQCTIVIYTTFGCKWLQWFRRCWIYWPLAATELAGWQICSVGTGMVESCHSNSNIWTLLHRIQTHKRFKRMLIYYDIYNMMQIFREIPFFRPQNNSETVTKKWKIIWEVK